MAQPPTAQRVPTIRERHGDAVVDEYAWLRNRDDPEVIGYLEAENAYAEEAAQHTKDLQARLFDEIRGRIQETDLSVPTRHGPWWWYSRTEEGQQYGIAARKPVVHDDELVPSDEVDEQIVLDQNVEAGDSAYFAVGMYDTSLDHNVLAWSADRAGAEVYQLRFRDLRTGIDLPDVIEGTYYGSAWAADNQTFFYTRPDDAMRPYQVWRHVLGTSADEDVLVRQEDDERFFVGISLTKDERFLVLEMSSKVTSEAWILEADDPLGEFRVVQPREQDVEYGLEHHGDRLFIVTNADDAENFKLVEAPDSAPHRDNWVDVVPHRPDVKVSGLDVFADHLVLFEREKGVRQIRVRRLSDGNDHVIEQPEAVSTTSGGSNPEFTSHVLRYGYTSLVTPGTVFDYDLITRERTLRKQQPVLGGYDAADYASERLWARADDGVEVPISIVYRRDRDKPGPVLLYGYGSYEASMDPSFSSLRLSLLDRGFAFAIAHIRGGGEMGRRWYLGGKYLHKRNTFTDFIAAGQHLVDTGWTTPRQLAIRGGSAGGLLVGAVANLRPELFGAVVAQVPFVDALNTILDPSLPLTVLEWEEWGNPVESAEFYEYMKSYAPYENVEAKDYPSMLVTAGLNDPRVSYWEPAKWVARLRATKTDDNLLLLKTEMGAGHGGPSGRYDSWKEECLIYAFLLDVMGVA
jgi:oligopeptidase B